MEKVCNRPNSLPALRQRIQPDVDSAFRPQNGRYGSVQTKLNRVATEFGRIHLRDMPATSPNEVDIRPRTSSLEVIAIPTPRNMSAPGARFSYDGLDLTGVIRSRLLNQEPTPCHGRREHSSAVALKRHIRKMEERKLAKKTQKRLLSASLTQFSSDTTLTHRKSWRETRTKPWQEEVPRYARPTIGLPISSKKAIAASQSKMLEDAWLEERDNEMWAINRKGGFQPVTVVLVSSQLQSNTSAEILMALRETECILPVVYDYMGDSHTEIIRMIKETLEEFGVGIKAEHLVVMCHGGPGHIFLQHKQIMTSVKIRKNDDIKRFWGEVGKLMSKRDYMKTSVILGGSNFASYPSGVELLSDLKVAIKPNKVSVQALPMKRDLSSFDKDLIMSLFVSVESYMRLFKLVDEESDSYSD